MLKQVDFESELQPQLGDTIPKELPIISFCALGATGAEKQKVDVVYAGNFARAIQEQNFTVSYLI